MILNNILFRYEKDVFLPSPKGKTTYQFAIPLTKDRLSSKAKLFQQLHNTEHLFCFTIHPGLVDLHRGLSKQSLVHHLTTFLFLPNYFRFKGKFVIIVEGKIDSDAFEHRLKSDLTTELGKQGIDNIVFVALSENNMPKTDSLEIKKWDADIESNKFLEENNPKAHFANLVEHITTILSPHKKWIVPISTEEDLAHKTSFITNFGDRLLSAYPPLKHLVESYYNKEEASTQLSIENKALKSKLQNSAYYLKTLRATSLWYVQEYNRLNETVNLLQHSPPQGSETGNQDHFKLPEEMKHLHQYDTNFESSAQHRIAELSHEMDLIRSNRDNILEWYKKEYETLPIWYKRFGHIIKVMTGKRTFKSLYKKS